MRTVGLLLWLMAKALIPALRRKTSGKDEAEGLIGKQMPFGPMLAAGGLLYLLLLEKEVDQYFDLVKQLIQ